MATVSVAKVGSTHGSIYGNTAVPYLVEAVVDFAKVATKKGSAIAVGDVIEAIHIPVGSQVLFAGLQVMEKMTGTSTDATVDLGVTGGDVDAFVDGFDLDAGAVGAYATPATAAITPATAFFTTADTIDLLIATQTGTITGGKVRVFATVLDVSDRASPGIAKLGS